MPSNSPRDQTAESTSKFKLRPVDFDGAAASSSSDDEFDEPSALGAEPIHQRSGSSPKQADSGSTGKLKLSATGMPRSASAETPESPSQSRPDWSLEPTPVNATFEVQDSSPLPRLNGKHETPGPAPPGSVAAVRETSTSRKPPAAAQAPMQSSSSSDKTAAAPPRSSLPPEIASLGPDQIQQLLASLQPEQLSKMLHVIAPSVLAPMGIVSSTGSLPTAPAAAHRPSSMARANTHPSNSNIRTIPKSGINPSTSTVPSSTSRGQPGNTAIRQDASGGGRASDSDGEVDRDVSVGATNDPTDSSRLTDSERRPRGRQAAPPDPTAGYKPREGHEYQPRDSRRSGSGAELVWNYSTGRRASIPEPRQTPSRQVPDPQQLTHHAQLPHEDASVAALRIAMETMTREAARAATMEARYQQALSENEKLKEANGAMQSNFDLQLERVLREQQTLRDQMYQQQADRIRVLEDRLKQAQADRQAAQNALRHAEMQAAQVGYRFVPVTRLTPQKRQGDPRREPYVNTTTAPRYPGPPPPPPPIDTGLNLSQSHPQPPVRPKEELHQSPAIAYAPRSAATEGQSLISPQVDVDARRQRMAKYPPTVQAPHPAAPSPPAPAVYPPAADPNASRGTKRPPPPAAPASLSASPRPQAQLQRKEGPTAEDDERARKRQRAEPGNAPKSADSEKTKAQEEQALMHHKIAALYEPDQAGNHVCKVCTAHQAPGGGRVGFPRETAPELLAAHAQAEHNGAWEMAGRPGKS
ncbi:hypothetical protein AURDEDRAFT_152868 [Auricularia subglabra TFB-10046 SS5]|nr:hypothetical protein AURDEDRAFT_152868 [Auricularia subglabra TFB-10046 SS5]